jgi:hypothetical protein
MILVMEGDTTAKNKIQSWETKLHTLDGVTDALGTEIEPGVRELIVGFNLLGIPTSSSCEGHVTGDISMPYIQGEALDEPEYRYNGEADVVRILMEKYGFKSKNEIFANTEAEDEYYASLDKQMETNDETDDYKVWYPKNKNITDQVRNLIDEFNRIQVRDSEQLLHLAPTYPGYRVMVDTKDMSPSDSGEVVQSVLSAQKAFSKFSDFVKTKYFESNT